MLDESGGFIVAYPYGRQRDTTIMKHAIDPKQKWLFDTEHHHFSGVGRRRLEQGWQGIFRTTLLELMPVEKLGTDFSQDQGRPTKELYAMAGLMVIQQMQGWTAEEAADAYMFDLSVQYALNVGHHQVELSARSVERYQRIFREKELAQDVFAKVTATLVKNLGLEIEKQRLDSTHIFSDMATFSRTQLMGVCIRRFLSQLKRHHQNLFFTLGADVRERYASSEKRLFGQRAKDRSSRERLRQQVAEDLLLLLDRFADHERVVGMSSYKAMKRVFEEQCEVKDNKVVLRTKTGGRVMQNPSDPDASYDGHKGSGYQIQLSETCHSDNPVQLITAALAEPAAEDDGHALVKVVEHLEAEGLKPAELVADTLYGSDDNQQFCEAKSIDLVAPVRGPTPADHIPATTPKQQRLARRRELEQTEAWQARYHLRAPIEGTNSGLKRRLGCGRLRVRGKQSVFNVLYLKVTGWNILRAASTALISTKKGPKPFEKLTGRHRLGLRQLLSWCQTWLEQMFSPLGPELTTPYRRCPR